MYKLIIYEDVEQINPIFLGYFKSISDINKYTNGLIKHSDCYAKEKKYITYKSLFKIIKV
jgi:hypothetical protein